MRNKKTKWNKTRGLHLDDVAPFWNPFLNCLLLVWSFSGNLDDNHKNETKLTNQTDSCDLVEEHDSSRKLRASQLTKNKESTLWTDKSDESFHTRDDISGEELIDIMNFMSLFKTEHVAVKDSIDEISSNLQETETAISPLNSAGEMKTS